MENLGIVVALGAAIAWGIYPVPFKISKSNNLIQFQALTGVGIFLAGLIISAIAGYSLNLNFYGLFSGVLWGIANAIFLTAIFNLGISRAVPIASSLVILSSFLWGVLVFGEIPSGIVVGLLGIGAIILGVILVSTVGSAQSRNIKKGLAAAVLSGIIFGSQLIPLKIGHLETKDFFFPMCLGIFLTGLVIFFTKKDKFSTKGGLVSGQKKEIGWGFLSGAIWCIGSIQSLIAISLVGLAKAIPVTQSSTLIAVLWGVFYFKEVNQKRDRVQILIGAVILLLGVMILSQA